MNLLNITVGEDMSLEAEKTRTYCKYAMPDAQAKMEAWALITDPKSNLSRKVKEEVMVAFQHVNQLDLVDNYVNH